MNAINPAADYSQGSAAQATALVSAPQNGAELTVGNGFEARSFRARDVGAVMDPLVMVDHYVMTEPTFGAHPHAGMSAVTLLFEDSEGRFHNRDSLGNDFDLHPGDLYWLSAGSGAVHDEAPREGARTHGLQVFVNVPQVRRFEAPASLLVRAKDMPVLSAAGYRVRVALGESHGVRGAVSPALPMTILDGTLQEGGRFSHRSKAKRGIWIHAIEGSLDIVVGAEARSLASGQALAINAGDAADVRLDNPSREPVQFALFDGGLIGETYIQDGPFVMGTAEEIADIKAAYKAGRLGGDAFLLGPRSANTLGPAVSIQADSIQSGAIQAEIDP
ncbi:MAG: pirin family protein [Pseudomonadota bacterium]